LCRIALESATKTAGNQSRFSDRSDARLFSWAVTPAFAFRSSIYNPGRFSMSAGAQKPGAVSGLQREGLPPGISGK
jgi:hypothetical protein